LDTARSLLNLEGILGGSSTGTLLASALRYCKDQTQPKNVLTFVCDSGNKYLSKMYNNYWMIDQGFIKRETQGNLIDLISRKKEEGGVVFVSPNDTLNTAYARMKLYDVSQLPVLFEEKIIGLLDESDLLLAIFERENGFQKTVSEAMNSNLIKVKPDTSLSELMEHFRQGLIAIVEDNQGQFHGLITQIDLLNHLRRKLTN
jgi:cystathionine beta-synthase